MNFCKQCQSILEKEISHTGAISFLCIACNLRTDGSPADTLIHEEFLEMAEIIQKYDVFVSNSPYDHAGNIVKQDCPKCKLDFMTLVRIGVNESIIYTCVCGHRVSYNDYKSA